MYTIVATSCPRKRTYTEVGIPLRSGITTGSLRIKFLGIYMAKSKLRLIATLSMSLYSLFVIVRLL